LILAITALAHDKMASPQPRVTSESTAQFCGAGNAAVGQPSGSVIQGTNLPVRWDGNHATGNVNLYLITPVANPTQAILNAGVLAQNVPYKTGGSPSASVPVPADKEPGLYTLVWEWSGYWACAEIYVTIQPPEGSTLASGSYNVYNLPDGRGTLDAAAGTVTCADGYKPNGDNTDCVSKAAAGVAIGVFFLVLIVVGVAVVAGTVIYMKKKHPEKLGMCNGSA